jgi:hypothetical protein
MNNDAEISTLRLQVAALEKQVSELAGKFEASKKPGRKPDLKHREWAIEERAKIQQTLLALYNRVLKADPEQTDWTLTYLNAGSPPVRPSTVDTFSLWVDK